ncbi:protein PTST homolog 3, chloroplastic isoform X2 [Ziziphus jujuba]|uniref:Protein PTST homolog 3, chloroplastic isoform X2 n=1 Tax=Ziziphus jujuba TaxID=326968 RepID=A0A6P4B818_ZIZJJ|nr:protein PTST homolog 3, chloroplastic isoform X2 [Ziziphus jujuba]
MATLCHFPRFRFLFLFDHHTQQQPRQGCYAFQHPPRKHLRLRASSIKKSRKVKSNAELCNDIREFVAAVGLPQDYVPTMKEFTEHGRNDLANIVRRRGYKVIREFLANSRGTDLDEEENKDEKKGQDVDVNNVVGEFPLSTEVHIIKSHSDSLITDPYLNFDDNSNVLTESSVDSSSQEKALNDIEDHLEMVEKMDEDISLASNVSTVKNHSSNSDSPAFDSGDHSCIPLEISTNLSMKEADLNELSGSNEIANSTSEDKLLSSTVSITERNFSSDKVEQDLKSIDNNQMPLESTDALSLEGKVTYEYRDEDANFAEEVVPSTEVSLVDYHSSSSNIDPVLSSDDHSSAPIGFSTELSLEEKVANFIQRGDLDVVEDNVYGTSNESGTEETKEYIFSEDTEEVQVRTPTSEHSENAINGGNSGTTSNGRASISMQAVPPATANDSPRNDSLSADGLGTQVNNDLDSEARKRETQVEISELKNMLHQKELELSRLKKQIEKEKLALSVLQIKAESAISKAQKIISEKDAELLAAEETLSGLVEVEVQYCGEGEMVEVAGSFNGWHHWVKMDLQPSSSITESSGTRKSRCWSTMMWLYPGVYEIKFVVDGHWKLDPQKESVTRGHISNNILRVNR